MVVGARKESRSEQVTGPIGRKAATGQQKVQAQDHSWGSQGWLGRCSNDLAGLVGSLDVEWASNQRGGQGASLMDSGWAPTIISINTLLPNLNQIYQNQSKSAIKRLNQIKYCRLYQYLNWDKGYIEHCRGGLQRIQIRTGHGTNR